MTSKEKFTSTLHSHPSTPNNFIKSVQVETILNADTPLLTYKVIGDIDKLLIPESKLNGRADNLWRHTCCEAFIATSLASGYREWNFSPSGQWQLYEFANYRQGCMLSNAIAPQISQIRRSDEWTLTVCVPPSWLVINTELRIGLTLVLEDKEGRMYYWALSHPSGAPDFHNASAWISAD